MQLARMYDNAIEFSSRSTLQGRRMLKSVPLCDILLSSFVATLLPRTSDLSD